MTDDRGSSGSDGVPTISDARPAACAGLKVVDLTQGMSGPMATMILADYGAQVVKVEPPGGDWARSRLRGFHMWNRGKQSIVVDLADPAQRGQLSGLLEWADVVVTDARPSVASRFGIDPETLADEHPQLLHCHIGTWAGAGDDDAPVYEAQLAAATGQMTGLGVLSGQIVDPSRPDPTFTLPPTASYGAAMLAVQGILAALIDCAGRAAGGDCSPGGQVRTSLLQGAMAFLMRQDLARPVPVAAHSGDDVMTRGIELCFLTAECSDGRFVQMCARQDHHFRLWLRALDLEHLLDEQRFAGAPMRISTLDDVAELELTLRARMRTRSQAEWMELFTTEFDVGADPFLTPEEFLAHPQMVANGRVASLDDPQLGPVTELGMLVEIDGATRTTMPPAPTLDQHGDELRSEVVGRSARPAPPATSDRQRVAGSGDRPLPLEGVTILEVAYFVAGPLATTLLAEMGARVIKVEPLDGDPYRRTGLQSTKFLGGKQSIALDLKHPSGRSVLHHLIRQSDAIVHSFRAGVAERLGMDEATARSLQPEIVYLNAASYGSRGPQAGRIAFHSTPTALSGAGIAQAGRGNKPVDDSFPDPAAGLGAATALLIGLYAQRVGGRGSSLETTMLTSAGYVMSNNTVVADGTADGVDRRPRAARHLGHLPPLPVHRRLDVHRCADRRPRPWPARGGALRAGGGQRAVPRCRDVGGRRRRPCSCTGTAPARVRRRRARCRAERTVRATCDRQPRAVRPLARTARSAHTRRTPRLPALLPSGPQGRLRSMRRAQPTGLQRRRTHPPDPRRARLR